MPVGEWEGRAGALTLDGVARCAVCDRAVPAGRPARQCPFGGEVGCPQAEESAPRDDDPLAETIAYHGVEMPASGPPAEPLPPADGFPVEDDLAGQRLGQYRLGEVIGRGQMGRVYRAIHVGLGRTCAIKVMDPGLVRRQPQVVERFWAEARAVAGLIHPHVVTVHNLGEDRGYHYIEMEHVAGGVSLSRVLVRDGRLDPLRATALVRQVALALGAAHRAGLVHRDVKPANVLLTAEGSAKLADFGLVFRLGKDRAGGPLAGTPTFMAPELFAGAPANPRTDLYAVGVMYYYLLSARLPFSADRLSRLIRLHRRQPVPDVRIVAPDVPEEAAAILDRLLAKEPDRRYESADALADDLRRLQGHLRETESLVEEALDGVDCFVQHGGRDQYRVVVPVPGDRLQEVYIEVAHGRDGEHLLQVYSLCGPAEPSNYEFALRLNSELTIGGLSIREVHGQPMFVMTRTYGRGHVTAGDIRSAVVEIARRGDWVEQRLTRDDVY